MEIGSTWAGKYSRWTFVESKGYMMVAKEMKVPGSGQKVPLLDAELNENAEIQLSLLRRMIERTYGNGTKGDGFLIAQSSSNTVNNFMITGGDGTVDGAGYIFVSGWMPFLLSSIEYTAQSGATSLTTPTADRTDEVYLDVYYEEVGPTTDSYIIDSDIGFETSRRIKLAWLVKVAEGGTTPAGYIDSYNVQHWTHHIATIKRLANNSNILSSMIVDKRNSVIVDSYLHTQSTAASTWTVAHNLGTQYVTVQVFTSAGVLMMPNAITYVDSNDLTIDFDGISVPGYAIIKAM